jgi:hypothetical protein
MLLESASTECKSMHYDMKEDAILPDMDTIYSAAEEMRRFADRLNNFADELMIVYRKMDHHQAMIDLDDLRSESYAQ